MSNYSLKRFIKSTLRLESYVAHYRLMSLFPSYLHQVAIGLLLSDGSIERPTRTGGARLSVILGINSLPYLLHLFNLFEPYIDSGFSISEVYNKKTGKYYETTRFKTGMMPIFVYYHDMFYYYDEVAQKYIKRVPLNIDSLMTPVVLANLIMGDGNLKRGEEMIRIYTNSFTKLEVEKLAFAITSKLNIRTKAVHDRNGQYILIINKLQLNAVRTLIESYMHPSMLYKLGMCAGTVGFNYKNILDQI